MVRGVRWRQARQSGKLALVVSPFLLVVNHYDELARGCWSGLGLKALLTFLVPFLVSCYSATAAVRESGRHGSGPCPPRGSLESGR